MNRDDPQPEIARLLHAAAEQTLSPSQWQALNALLRDDVTVLDRYIDQITLTAFLQRECVASDGCQPAQPHPDHDVASLLMEVIEQERLARAQRDQSGAQRQAAEEQEARERLRLMLAGQASVASDHPRRDVVIPRPLFYGVLAAVAAAVALLVLPLLPIGDATPELAPHRPDPIAGVPAPVAEPLATLTDAHAPRWQGRIQPRIGDRLVAGDYTLGSGLVEFSFTSGARTIIEGPARFTIASDRRMMMHRGALTAKVPPSAVGFTVTGPGVRIVDLGTEFGMRVADGRPVGVTLFKGVIEVALIDEQGAHGPVQRIDTASTLLADARRGELRPVKHLDRSLARSISPRDRIVETFDGTKLDDAIWRVDQRMGTVTLEDGVARLHHRGRFYTANALLHKDRALAISGRWMPCANAKGIASLHVSMRVDQPAVQGAGAQPLTALSVEFFQYNTDVRVRQVFGAEEEILFRAEQPGNLRFHANQWYEFSMTDMGEQIAIRIAHVDDPANVYEAVIDLPNRIAQQGHVMIFGQNEPVESLVDDLVIQVTAQE